MNKQIPIIDLFAGPGGLSEGFLSVSKNGESCFRLALSIEKDESARATLKLRALTKYLSQQNANDFPIDIAQYLLKKKSFLDNLLIKKLWKDIEKQVPPLELAVEHEEEIFRIIGQKIERGGDWVLVGGPPCQAYSVIGRSRNQGIASYDPGKDQRHFLYREYLKVIAQHAPAVFVMENVRGILSSKISGHSIFEKILEDLSFPANSTNIKNAIRQRYHIKPIQIQSSDQNLELPINYLLKSENYGVPQARHRVFLLGIREDLSKQFTPLLPKNNKTSAGSVLDGLLKIRSQLSRTYDSSQTWQSSMLNSFDQLNCINQSVLGQSFIQQHACVIKKFKSIASRLLTGNRVAALEADTFMQMYSGLEEKNPLLAKWYRGSLNADRYETRLLLNHESRSHMSSDLTRYLFCSIYAQAYNQSPTKNQFPEELAPNHRSWNKGHFSDRFRVQISNAPSTTVTCHISKDGHYYIHPDPVQCRSLTVREAARLQTFPDDYFFEGNKTSQYVQVGNAVPPLLARQIAEEVLKLF